MIVDRTNIQEFFNGLQAAFGVGLGAATREWEAVATRISSSTEKEFYGHLSQFPSLRKWVDDKQIKSLKARGVSLLNEDYESTIGIDRNHLEDATGVAAAIAGRSHIAREQGQAAGRHVEKNSFDALADGDSTTWLDGENFFSATHTKKGGTQSNIDAGGAGPRWWLMDTSRSIKPVIYQTRKDPTVVNVELPTAEAVFMRRELLFGVEARSAWGYGWWQTAFQSNQTLNDANFDAAFEAMMQFEDDDEGERLGIRPTLLVVSANNRGPALDILEKQLISSGETNRNFRAVDLLISPWLPTT
jgi:phage major head subunit gpT-like protein